MAPIRNTCVARGVIAANEYLGVYSIPPGYVLLLKDIRLYCSDAAGSTANVNIYPSGGSGYLPLELVDVPGAAAAHAWVGWIALNSGDAIAIQAGTAEVGYWISGALLPYAPSLPATGSPPVVNQLPADGSRGDPAQFPVPPI
jgi:hypothetical protein